MFKNVFSFQGRIRRTEYGLSLIINFVLSLPYSILKEMGSPAASYLILPQLFLFIFIILQSTRRCHDLGHSGWWQIIPFYGFWLLFAKGEEGENKYGRNPKDPQF